MRRVVARVACFLTFASAVGCIPIAVAPRVAPGAVAGPLKRGMNLGNRLDAPSEGEWGPSLSEALFEGIAAAGFDHVRIPIRFNTHATSQAPYPIDEDFLRRVDWAVDQAQIRGMSVIIDFHHYMELMTNPDANADRFVGIWKQVAARYRGRPASVYLELLNEPNGALTADKWNALLARALKEVRAVDPTRKVIVDSYFWAAGKELASTLVLPEGDPNLIGSFHMYQPILFTHQGSRWMTAEYQTLGVLFPGPPKTPIVPAPGAQSVDWVARWFQNYNTLPADKNPSGPTTIAEEFEYAQRFIEKTKLPVYLGEFGAADSADKASRVRWTRMVTHEAAKRGIPWTYWDDAGSFKVFDQNTGVWDTELKAALLE